MSGDIINGLFKKGGSRDYYTVKVINWDVGKKGSGFVITVPKGREFESSVPKILRWVLSPDNPRYLLSAVIHDFLLEENYRPFFVAGEWYDAAIKSGGKQYFTFTAALAVTTFSVMKRVNKKVMSMISTRGRGDQK